MSETGSQVSWDDFSDSRCVSPALSCDFDISDTSWADSSVSPGSDVASPETPSNSSIWARFNSGISRFTQDLGKTSSAHSSTIPSVQVSVDERSVVPPRDDFVEGAESDVKSEPSESGIWSLSESFRKFSASLSQSVNMKSYSSDAADSNWFGGKLVARSHSSNVLDDACSRSSADENGSHDVGEAVTLRDDTVAVSTHDSSVTSVLNQSETEPFTAVSDTHSKTTDVEVDALEDSSVSVPSFATPQRLASKPPLPQRSGTLTPRELSSRPRPTHRRSQSLQHFTPTGGFVPVSDKSTVSADICPPAQNDAARSATENVPSTHEIFV